MRLVKQAGLRCVVDTHGACLENGLLAEPTIVKVNAHEAADLVRQPVENFEQALLAAVILRRRGAGTAMITLGGSGAVASSSQGNWIGRAPRVKAIAPVGSGDAFLGGLVLALSRGATLPEGLRLGIAAGAANAQTMGVAMIDPESVAGLADQTSILQV